MSIKTSTKSAAHRVNHSNNDITDDILSPKQALNIPVWLVWLMAMGFVFVGLGSYGILDNNEGLYSEIPREMLAAHDWRAWIIPHLNGLPYMEKPPLLYWLTALSFSLFGIAEWSARLVPALSALFTVGLLLRFGDAVQKPLAGRLAAVIFISGIGVAVMSRTLMFDMLLTATLTAALIFAYRFHVERQAVLLRWAYVYLALALLAKGVVALLLFGLIVVCMLLPTIRKPGALLGICRDWLEPRALLIFFAIAAPWHIAASFVEPIFPWFYFINEHVLRFLGKREPHDYYAGPLWYYLPRMVLYLFPWPFLLPGMWQRPEAEASGEQTGLSRFLTLAWLLPLIFFSVSSAKANYYLVVVMPFVAFQLALALERRNFLNPRFRLLPGVMIALLMGALAIVAMRHTDRLPPDLHILGFPVATFVLAILFGLSGLALLCGLLAWRVPRLGILTYLVLPAWSAAALIIAVNAVEPQVSTRPLAIYLQVELPGRAVYLFRNFEEQSSLPFYMQKPLGLIDSRSSDLYWGNKLQPNNLFVSSAQFEKIASGQQVVVVVMERQLKDFKAGTLFAKFSKQKQIGGSTVFFN